jgi:aminopeptidase N
VVVTAVHEDTWPYAVFSNGPLGTVALGQSSGLQGFLPSVLPHAFGSPWKFHAQVAVPQASRLTAAVSGRTLGETEENGWRVVEVDSEGHVAYWPSIGVGRFVSVDDPAQQGFPAIRVRAFGTHFGTIEQFGPETRRVVQFYEGYLPPYPVREVEVFEAPARFDGFTWIAPHGMVNLQMMLSTAGHVGGGVRDEPHLESAVYAHELAHQYWGHLAPPATTEDFWIAESFSELFACLYVSAAFDSKDCALRMKHKRETWEAAGAPTEGASLSRAYSSASQPAIVYDYGPYLLGEMLIRRIGRQSFFAAIDVMLREHPYEPLTTERVESYLSLASGQDLGAFFDTWVHGGRLPRLALDWSVAGRTVTGKVTSDIPFGTFDVPIAVRAKDAVSTVFVTVTDGEGAFTVEAPTAKVDLLLDPEGYVMARSRVVRRQAR